MIAAICCEWLRDGSGFKTEISNMQYSLLSLTETEYNFLCTVYFALNLMNDHNAMTAMKTDNINSALLSD